MGDDWRSRADNYGVPMRGDQKFGLPEKQVEDDPHFKAAEQRAVRHWETDNRKGTPMWHLLIADSKLALLQNRANHGVVYAVEFETLKSHVAAQLRVANARDVLGDYRTVGLVRFLFGESGLDRLRARSQQ